MEELAPPTAPIASIGDFPGSHATTANPIAAGTRTSAGAAAPRRRSRDDGLYRIQGLDEVVRFEACRDPRFNHGYSQFDGGIVVAGRRCFSLDIYFGGRHYPRRGLLDC
jgi:hypothetical protein